MTVFAVHEECHGLVGTCAANVESMVGFLIETEWIHEKFQIYVEKLNQRVSLRAYFGEHWEDRLREMTVDELKEVFDGDFYFEKLDVYGVD